MTVSAKSSISFRQSRQLSNPLLVQFILVHYIESHSQLQLIESKTHRKYTALSKEEWISSKAPLDLYKLEELLTQLTGCSNEQTKSITSNFTEGILFSIKKHTLILLQNTEINEKDFAALHHYADKLLQSANTLLETIRECHFDSLKFVTALDKTLSSLKSLGKQLLRILAYFKDNENILFCMLCYKESLDAIFGRGAVAKLLTKNSGHDLAQIGKDMSEKYGIRGFQHLLPAIHSKISELETD